MTDHFNKLPNNINALDADALQILAKNSSFEARSRLADVVIQFWEIEQHSTEEKARASELILHLIRQAELELRELLAERLSLMENIPPEIIYFLAHDEISVANPVLLYSPILTDSDLLKIIANKNQEHWRCLAMRHHISPKITDRLIDTGDTGTVLRLMNNPDITLPRSSMMKVIRLAMRDEALQEPLLHRPEMEPDLAIDLYLCISYALRKEMAQRFHFVPATIEAALDNLVSELSMDSSGTYRVTQEMSMVVRRIQENGNLTPELMIKALRRGQISFFIALLSEKLGFKPETVLRLVQKENGMSFALACRSTGMMKSSFASIYLLSRHIGNQQKIVDHKEFAKVLHHYDTIKDADVQRVMDSWMSNPDLL